MKSFAWLFVAVAGLAVLGQLFSPAEALAMDQASTKLSHTETDLKTAVSATAAKAEVVAQHVESPDRRAGLSADLQAFSTVTQRLLVLRENLVKDMGSYDDARTKKLDELTKELSSISDPTTRRSMETLRRRAEAQGTERLATARSALASLDEVIAQGGDLQHAARCVLLADEFSKQGDDLDAEVRQARATATSYAQLTTDLLSRITRALNT